MHSRVAGGKGTLAIKCPLCKHYVVNYLMSLGSEIWKGLPNHMKSSENLSIF